MQTSAQDPSQTQYCAEVCFSPHLLSLYDIDQTMKLTDFKQPLSGFRKANNRFGPPNSFQPSTRLDLAITDAFHQLYGKSPSAILPDNMRALLARLDE